ncbi:hypothetical protein ACLQ2N_35585 [Streptomyces sp. DT224]|uniref:hypothetical protein n=1 Tax=Streptomyces sp. DT224 TaxID=3393426 RepID=UPI003CF668D3
MTKNAKIGAALVGGYLLGRTKKAKLAVGFGMFLLGKKFDLDPRRIGRMLAESPALGPLNDQVRKELVDATRTAATKAVTQRAGHLAESLQRRTQSLEAGPAAEDEEPAEGAEDTEDTEDTEDAEDAAASDDGAGTDRDTKQKRRASARKSAASGAGKAAPKSRPAAGAGRSGSTGKAAAPARKRAGTAAKATASRTRKARGGSDA